MDFAWNFQRLSEKNWIEAWRNSRRFSWISEIVWLKCPKNILWTCLEQIGNKSPKVGGFGDSLHLSSSGICKVLRAAWGKPKVVRCSWRRNQPPAQSKRWPFWCSPHFEKLGLSHWLWVWKRTQWSPQISSYFSFAVVSLCFCFVVEYQMARNDRRDLWRDDHVVSHRGNDVGHRHYFKRIWGWILSDLWNTIWNRHTSYHIYPYYGSGMIRWSMKSYIWGMDIHESQLWIGVTTFDRPYPS